MDLALLLARMLRNGHAGARRGGRPSCAFAGADDSANVLCRWSPHRVQQRRLGLCEDSRGCCRGVAIIVGAGGEHALDAVLLLPREADDELVGVEVVLEVSHRSAAGDTRARCGGSLCIVHMFRKERFQRFASFDPKSYFSIFKDFGFASCLFKICCFGVTR